MGIDECILSKPTDEQKNKTEAAQAPEELLAIAKEAGYELSPEQLEAVSGGKYHWCISDGCQVVCYEETSCIKHCYKYNK